MPENITINNHTIKCGQQKEIQLKIARLPSFETIELPVTVYRAATDGPVLLLTGGIHGDEINGIEIIRRMIAQELIKPEIGTVIAVPLVNVFGFIQKERDMPDGKDINRSFPGSKSGSLARLVAHTLMDEIFPHIDYGVDFHTGGRARANYPQIRCDLKVAANKELASAFSPPMVIHSSLVEHSFRKTAQKRGKQILVYETGEASRFYEFGIQQGIAGTLRLMKHLGMRTKAPESMEKTIFHKSTWIRAKSAGVFHAEVTLGDTVDKRQIVGYLSDPFGKESLKVKSPQQGRIFGVNNAPVVHKGDALLHIAYN